MQAATTSGYRCCTGSVSGDDLGIPVLHRVGETQGQLMEVTRCGHPTARPPPDDRPAVAGPRPSIVGPPDSRLAAATAAAAGHRAGQGFSRLGHKHHQDRPVLLVPCHHAPCRRPTSSVAPFGGGLPRRYRLSIPPAGCLEERARGRQRVPSWPRSAPSCSSARLWPALSCSPALSRASFDLVRRDSASPWLVAHGCLWTAC